MSRRTTPLVSRTACTDPYNADALRFEFPVALFATRSGYFLCHFLGLQREVGKPGGPRIREPLVVVLGFELNIVNYPEAELVVSHDSPDS